MSSYKKDKPSIIFDLLGIKNRKRKRKKTESIWDIMVFGRATDDVIVAPNWNVADNEGSAAVYEGTNAMGLLEVW